MIEHNVGECLVDISNILIEESDLGAVQDICSWIEDPAQKEIMAAKILGIEVAAKFFSKRNVNVDKTSGLYDVSKIMEDYDISDIYADNCYIDVRICKEDSLSVPKVHFENNLLPSAYMFISVADDLKSAGVLGFVLSESINTSSEANGMIRVSPDTLISYEEIKDYLEPATAESDITEADMYSYLEDTLGDKVHFIDSLIHSKEGRELFKKIERAQRIFNFVSEFARNQVQNNKSSGFEYSTVTSPSISEYEGNTNNIQETVTEETPVTGEDNEFVGEQTLVMSDDGDGTDEEYEASGEEIRALFAKNAQKNNSQQAGEDLDAESAPVQKQKKSPLLLILFLIVAIIGAGCYFFLTKSSSGVVEDDSSTTFVSDNNQFSESELPNTTDENAVQQDAMPIESIEQSNANKINNKTEGNAIAIPAIEQNLDASILVSNLKIDWEVPAGYASNTAAKRYLIKLGKIVQLNLKSELLLLNKPPLSNKIAVEIQYDNSAKRFNAVGIITSSGEKTIDDVIMQTVNKALKMKVSTSIDSFAKIPGNPVLIIKL